MQMTSLGRRKIRGPSSREQERKRVSQESVESAGSPAGLDVLGFTSECRNVYSFRWQAWQPQFLYARRVSLILVIGECRRRRCMMRLQNSPQPVQEIRVIKWKAWNLNTIVGIFPAAAPPCDRRDFCRKWGNCGSLKLGCGSPHQRCFWWLSSTLTQGDPEACSPPECQFERPVIAFRGVWCCT